VIGSKRERRQWRHTDRTFRRADRRAAKFNGPRNIDTAQAIAEQIDDRDPDAFEYERTGHVVFTFPSIRSPDIWDPFLGPLMGETECEGSGFYE
jgi:hypothetical protein